jgi:hypothetical protein
VETSVRKKSKNPTMVQNIRGGGSTTTTTMTMSKNNMPLVETVDQPNYDDNDDDVREEDVPLLPSTTIREAAPISAASFRRATRAG